MVLVLAALLSFSQESNEDFGIISKRNIFSPAKPKKKEETKKEEKKEEKKPETPPAPVITGFEGYPDGFRVLVHDRAKGTSVRYGVGEPLAGGTIEWIDNTRATIRIPSGTMELRAGDAVSGGTPAAPKAGGPETGTIAPSVDSKEVREKMKKRIAKQVEEEEPEEDAPRKKRRGDRR